MSEGIPPPPDQDPFRAEDPAAAERERRRLEREERRKSQAAASRRSLGSRVSEALEGAAERGREAVSQGRERIAEPRPETGAHPSSPPAPPSRTQPEPVAGPQFQPEPPPQQGQAPPPSPPPPGRAVYGRPPGGPGGGDQTTIWRRRALVLGAAIAVVAVVALLARGGDAPAPSGGVKTLKTFSVTIPEGYTIDQIDAVAKDAGLKGSYADAATKPPKGFDPTRYGAPRDAPLEGFLFPATYELEKGAPASDLVDKQLAAFEQNISGVDMGYAKSKNLNTYDVLKIASMIEREVMIPDERPLVSAVIYNRLAAGEPLGIDSTLRYELGNYDKQLLESQLQTDSPYNTRTRAGLPPTPIGNPGLDSIKAAAKPANSDAYYFVVKPGTCGEHFFTASSAEFDAAVARYQAALQAQGGSPTDCPG